MTMFATFSMEMMRGRVEPDTRRCGGHRWTRFGAALTVATVIAASAAVGVLAPRSAFADPPIATVPLGSAATFAVLTAAAVGNTASGPVTTLRGDLGAGGGTTGFPPGVYTGNLYTGTAANPALADLDIAYANAAGRPAGIALAADLLNKTAGPGVHTNSGAVANTGTFTIDAAGDPNAVFIFQIGGALSMAAGSHVVLAGQARASNVFWVVNGAGAVGADASFAGTLMASAAIGVGANTIFNGRALAQTGAITVNSNEFYSTSPTVSIDPGTSAYTTDTSPTITGITTVRSPSTVTITINGETLTATPAVNGTWSATPVGLLANAIYPVVASVVDGAGNTGTFSQQLTVDTIPPAVTIDGGASIVTNHMPPTITGTTDVAAGQIVALTMVRTSPGLTLSRSALVQADETWNITPNGFTAGVWTVTATVSDPAGNASFATQSMTIDLTAPVAAIDGGANALTNDATPTISGTSETGAVVTVSVDGAPLSGVSSGGGIWSVTYTATPLGSGAHNVAMTAMDPAGNSTSLTQTLTVDTVSPTLVIDGGPASATNDRTPTISGSTNVAAGVTVTVSISAGSPMTALVQSNHTWNVTPSALLDPGSYNVIASVADPAGNIGTYSQSLTIDVTNPTLSIDGGPSRLTGDATPIITGFSSDVAAGSAVTVAIAGQTLSTTIGIGGTFAVTAAAISNGTHFVLVTVTDAVGNSGTNNQSLTIDAVAPTVTIDGGADASTNNATPRVSGHSDAVVGSPVVVTVAGQTLHATVQPGGSWNVTAAHIDNGVEVVLVSVTDPDGNIGATSQNLAVDSTTATSIGIVGGPTRSTNDDTPTISGTTDASDGRILTVTIGGQTMTVAAAGGAWSVTAAHLADGIYAIDASVSSAGGNPGSGSQSLTIDTVAPVVVLPGGATVDTTDPTPTITGFGATPGSTVTVTVGGQTMTTTVGADGTWSVTPPLPLPAGAYTVTVTITDPAGNTGTGTQIINVSASLPTSPPPPTSSSPPTTPPSGSSSSAGFTSVGPKRVIDTRAGQSVSALRTAAKLQISGSSELQVQMTGLAGYVPSTGVGAVSLNVTSTGSAADGFVTVYACGLRELVSSVNFVAGKTVANAVVTPLSPSGTVCFFSSTPTDIIVDINGWFATGSAFTSVGPKRVFDTRPGNSPDALRSVPNIKIGPDGMREVRVTDLTGYVPADGVGSVSLNVTVTNPEAAGFITVYSCGTRALVSSVNFVAGQTVANAVIATVSAAGTVCFYSSAATDLVVDINGWLQAGSGFNAIDPARVLDTRLGNSPDALRDVAKVKIGGANVLQVQVTDLAGRVPADGVIAVSLNVTATNPDGDGFVTVYQCGALDEVSSLNFAAHQTVANAVLAPVSASGMICLFSNVATDVVVDISGWVGAA
jgi:hypothetical protein